MKTTPTERFHVDVDKVLSGAEGAGLVSIALVGVDADGNLYVASSEGSGKAVNLFDQAPAEIERLRDDARE